MSAALVQLVSKGAQDVYITNNQGVSLFNLKYKRHTNFSHAPKLIKEVTTTDNVIKIPVYGDLLNAIWFEGEDMINTFDGAYFHLYIGGVKIDSHSFEYLSDIWQTYLAENFVKSMEIINNVSIANNRFIPLHFFFCDNDMYLPLAAMQFHEVEIRIEFAKQNVSGIKCYGNYIFLDTEERNKFAEAQMDMLITQVQENIYDIDDTNMVLDVSNLNHPVKSIFFGFKAKSPIIEDDFLTFDGVDMYLNGTTLFENMSPLYFHIVQSYLHSKCGAINFVESENCPMYTRYYAYHFCKNASDYKPTGTCNFSRLDNAKLVIKNISRGSLRQNDNDMKLYAVNYNILRVRNGMAGILFAN